MLINNIIIILFCFIMVKSAFPTGYMRLGLLVCYGNFLLLLLFEDMFDPLRNYSYAIKFF